MNRPHPTTLVPEPTESAAPLSRGEWARKLVRLLALAGVLLLILGVVTSLTNKRGAALNAARNGAASRALGRGSSPDSVDSHATPSTRDAPSESSRNAPADSRSTTDSVSDGRDPDAGERPFESPLLRALGSVVDQHEQVFGDVSDEVERTLADGDRILSSARASNREAIRQANRQVRLPGRWPHLLILQVDGLTVGDLGCYAGGERLTPHVDAWSRTGARLTRFAADATSRSATIDAWRAEATPRLLWDSGYATYLLGDCSHPWSASPSWDHVFGWSSELVSARPPSVVSNGRTIGLANPIAPAPGDADARQPAESSARFDDVLIDEAASLWQAGAARRPVALILNTPLDWWRATAPDTSRAALATEWDRFFGRVLDRLDRTIGKERAIVILLATSRRDEDGKLELSAGGVPLAFAWPGRIPAGSLVEQPADYGDLLPTVARLIGSSRASASRARKPESN